VWLAYAATQGAGTVGRARAHVVRLPRAGERL